jgi:hypothetical protein
MRTEIDILGKVAERKKARSFGGDPEVRERNNTRNCLNHKVDRILELIDCCYKTLMLQIKSNHPLRNITLKELQGHLSQLNDTYVEMEELNNVVKVVTEVD